MSPPSLLVDMHVQSLLPRPHRLKNGSRSFGLARSLAGCRRCERTSGGSGMALQGLLGLIRVQAPLDNDHHRRRFPEWRRDANGSVANTAYCSGRPLGTRGNQGGNSLASLIRRRRRGGPRTFTPLTCSSARATGVFLTQLKVLLLLARYHTPLRASYHFLDKGFYHLLDKDSYLKRGWVNFWGLNQKKRGGMTPPKAA